MNDQTVDIEQADEDILTSTVSDEALEAAAGEEMDVSIQSFVNLFYCC